jgi:hypothetical protein
MVQRYTDNGASGTGAVYRQGQHQGSAHAYTMETSQEPETKRRK